MNKLRWLLFPLSLIYLLVVMVRNKFYDWGWFKSQRFSIPVICVGNLQVGGTGKSPMTEYLIRLLQNDFKVSVLSRGYGRKTSGFIEVAGASQPEDVGDEPLQFKKKFPSIKVAVCENRVKGIQILASDCDLVILDDGFQHRAVKPGMSLLLFDQPRLGDPKITLPAGDFREPLSGIKRADVVIITKVPKDDQKSVKEIISANSAYAGKPVFYSFLNYGELLPVFGETEAEITNSSVIYLLTGIANSSPLVDHLNKLSSNIRHYEYADHHPFTTKNISKLAQDFRSDPSADKVLITTEKDLQRLSAPEFKTILAGLPFFYLPVEADFFKSSKDEFDQLILNYVKKYPANN